MTIQFFKNMKKGVSESITKSKNDSRVVFGKLQAYQ